VFLKFLLILMGVPWQTQKFHDDKSGSTMTKVMKRTALNLAPKPQT